MEENQGLLKINPVGSLGPGDRLLVLLHGFGADENDLAPIVQHIDPDGRFTSVCLRAPIDLVPFGAAWYERDESGTVDAHTFKSSVQAIDRTIDGVCEAGGFYRSESVIIGFSQGCAMTLAVGLGQEIVTAPSAIACLSGMLQDIPDFELLQKLPVYKHQSTSRPRFGMFLTPIDIKKLENLNGSHRTVRKRQQHFQINQTSLATGKMFGPGIRIFNWKKLRAVKFDDNWEN